MVQEKITDTVRINARKTDAFDIFNFKHYNGPNPYLDIGALVFDFARTEYRDALPLEDYISIIGDRYPQIRDEKI